MVLLINQNNRLPLITNSLNFRMPGCLPRAAGKCPSEKGGFRLQAGVLEISKVIMNQSIISVLIYVFRRYKMISQFTWPNFHGGDAEEGTRVLLEDRKFLIGLKVKRQILCFFKKPTVI